MTSIDELLRQRKEQNAPIQIALVGAGAAARMIAVQLLTPPTGMRLAAIGNRTLATIEQACQEIGADETVLVKSVGELDRAITEGVLAITDDPLLLCESNQIDIIIDVTGTVEFGACLAMRAFERRKHLVLVNTELDSTLGPILKTYADRAGVTLTNTDGDEPGVAMTLLRYLKINGMRPVAAGNLKGMVDPYRTPETQRAFAAKYSMNPRIVTSFADGTKLAMEAAVLANASGFRVGQRGMYGVRCAHVNDIVNHLPREKMLNGGLVDYALGAEPHTGAFVVVHEQHPLKMKHLGYLKMGEGPFYVFYTPYHLPHVQVAGTIARAVLFGDATVSPLGAPICEVATIAKKDLRKGEVIDGVGGFAAYGAVENSGVFRADGLLPIGLAMDCRALREIKKDEPICFADVELPKDRICDQLWSQQSQYFSGLEN